jgi:hypothetical protein
VRQTLALEAQLDVENAELAARVAAERAEKRAEAARQRKDRIGLQTDRVYAAVGEAILAETAKADLDKTGARTLARSLDKQLRERLADPREEDDFADLPTSTLIARICETLGVPVDWDLWRDEPWAVAEWRAAAPGSPYAPKPAAASSIQDRPEARNDRRNDLIRIGEAEVAGASTVVSRVAARGPPDPGI